MKNLYLLFSLFAISTYALANPLSHGCDRAFLGVNSKTVSYEKAEKLGFDNPHGVYITGVVKNSAAEKAGLQPFDYIYAVDEFELTDNQRLIKILDEYEPGDKASIYFIRKGQKESVSVRLGKYGNFCTSNNFVKKSFLGVQKQDVTDDGIEISVIKGTSAERLGLKDGDIITEIDGIKMVDWSDLTLMMRTKSAEENIEVNYLRGGQSNQVSGELRSYAQGQAERWESYGRKHEDKWDRFEDKMERLGDRIEEEADQMEDEIERKVEEYFRKRRAKENRESEDNGSGYEENIRINRSPNDLVEETPQRPQVADLEASIEPVSSEELTSLDGDFSLENSEVLAVNNISLHPNSSTGHFKLSFDLPQKGNTIVQLHNTAGRVIYEYEMGAFSGHFEDDVDVSQNAPGEYYLIVKQNDNTTIKKVVFELQ